MQHKITAVCVTICVIVITLWMAGLTIVAVDRGHEGDLARQKVNVAKVEACGKADDVQTCLVLIQSKRR